MFRGVRTIVDQWFAFAEQVALGASIIIARLVPNRTYDVRFDGREATTPEGRRFRHLNELETMLKTAHAGNLRLVLASDMALHRTLELPAAARTFIAGVVRNKLDALSPWPESEVVYGFAMRDSAPDTLEIEVSLVARRDFAEIAAAMYSASATAVPVAVESANGIVVPIAEDGGVTVAPRGAQRAIAFGLIGAVLLTCTALTASFFASRAVEAEKHGHEQAIAEMRRTIVQRAAAAARPADAAETRAIALRRATPSVLGVLDALAATIPDNSYLVEVSMERTQVRIVGLSPDVPGVLAALHSVPPFVSAGFYAPTSRVAANGPERFHIELRTAER